MKLRGHIALTLVVGVLLVLDLVERLVIAPTVWLLPSSRRAVLGRWQRFIAHTMLFLIGRVGGAHIPNLPRIPARPGVLVLMNHQSLLDIPLVVASMDTHYPRIVTRRRYAARWIPVISHMLKLYQYPLVDPRANRDLMERDMTKLDVAAATSDVPLAIFPEGTRSRDGEIGHFRTTGLRRILGVRPWTVYVLVADGFWQHAKFKSLLRGMADIRGRISLRGPLEWEDPDADPTAFIQRIRELMVEELAVLRSVERV